MFEFINDMFNYEERKIGRTEIGGLTVSTAHTSDEGYETALIDKNGVHPVARYADKGLAEAGHEAWVKTAKKLKSGAQVIKLGGFGGLVEDKSITLEWD